MGLPAYVVPEDLVNNLEDILISEGINIQIKGFMPEPKSEKTSQYPNWLCKKNNECVEIYFGHPNTNPALLVVALQGKSAKWWNVWKSVGLTKEIQKILESHGAKSVSKSALSQNVEPR